VLESKGAGRLGAGKGKAGGSGRLDVSGVRRKAAIVAHVGQGQKGWAEGVLPRMEEWHSV
jgi:hypothetical protein